MKNKKIDILILCQYFVPENISSATLPYDTAKYLVGKGMTVDVLTGMSRIYNNQKVIQKKEVIDGINIRRIKYITSKRKRKLTRILSYISFMLANYLRIFSFRKYKVIMVYSNPPILPQVALLAKKLFNSKLVFVSYDVYPEIAIESNILKKNSLITKKINVQNRKLFPNIDALIALSSEMKNFLINNRNIDPDKIHIIPNWHEDLYVEEKLEKQDESLLIGYIGNMGVVQDIDTILKTSYLLKDYKQIKFIFAGHGSKIDDIVKFKKNNNLENIIIYGFLTGEDYSKMINSLDLCVVSLNQNISKLAFPSKISSYLMAGKPIISIMDEDSQISKEILNYQIGISVKNKEYDLLGRKILTLLTDRESVKKMGENSRNLYLEKYQPVILLEKYYTITNTMLEETNV